MPIISGHWKKKNVEANDDGKRETNSRLWGIKMNVRIAQNGTNAFVHRSIESTAKTALRLNKKWLKSKEIEKKNTPLLMRSVIFNNRLCVRFLQCLFSPFVCIFHASLHNASSVCSSRALSRLNFFMTLKSWTRIWIENNGTNDWRVHCVIRV